VNEAAVPLRRLEGSQAGRPLDGPARFFVHVVHLVFLRRVL